MKKLVVFVLCFILMAGLVSPMGLALPVEAAEANIDTNSHLYDIGVKQISMGYTHAMVLLNDGSVWGWGRNTMGQLGNGKIDDNIAQAPVKVSGLPKIQSIAAGHAFSIALDESGNVWAWGSNTNGQLGNGSTMGTGRYNASPVRVSNLSNIQEIGAGTSFAIALRSNGTVWHWGHYAINTTHNVNIPLQVPNLQNIKFISAEGSTALALRQDGSVWMWGGNFFGEAGNGFRQTGEFRYQVPPERINSLSNVVSIHTGHNHCFAILENGSTWGWGNNSDGELGDGSTTIRTTPVRISAFDSASKIVGGYQGYSLALISGNIWSAGKNERGQLGIENTSNVRAPVQLQALKNVVQVSASGNTSMALLEDGTVWTWGWNGHGQLGGRTRFPFNVNQTVPAIVIGPDKTQHTVTLTERWEDGATDDSVTTYLGTKGEPLTLSFTIPTDYKATIAESYKYTVDYTAGAITINNVDADIGILIVYQPVTATHTITVVKRFSDNAYPEDSTEYKVDNGQPFSTSFDIPDGYEVNSVNLLRTGVEVDILGRTINIEEVTQDMTVILLFTPKQQETETLQVAFAGHCTSDAGEYFVTIGGVISENLKEGVNDLSRAAILRQKINVFAVNHTAFDTNTMSNHSINSIQVVVENGTAVSVSVSGEVKTPKGSTDTYNIDMDASSSKPPVTPPGPGGAGVNDKDVTVNLADAAHRAGVTASSTWQDDPGYEPDKAVDDNASTRWASTDEAENPVTLTVHFKDLYTFNHVLIRACTDRITSYELQYLKPGTDDEWITFQSGGNLPDDRDVVLEDFGEITGDGVRLVMTRDSLAVSIYELQVRYQ